MTNVEYLIAMRAEAARLVREGVAATPEQKARLTDDIKKLQELVRRAR